MKVSYTLFALTHRFICRSVPALLHGSVTKQQRSTEGMPAAASKLAAQKEENYEKESRKFTRSYGSRSYCSGRMRIQ